MTPDPRSPSMYDDAQRALAHICTYNPGPLPVHDRRPGDGCLRQFAAGFAGMAGVVVFVLTLAWAWGIR